MTCVQEIAVGPALFQALGDCTCALDRSFRFVALDDAAAAYLGRPAAELLGRPIWEAFPALAAGPVAPLLRQAMADRRPMRHEVAGSVRPDRWIEITLFPTEGGLGVAFRDRTTARRATERLQANAEQLRDLLATLELGTSMARDLDGTIRFWSEGCARLYGWTEEEAVGRPAHELLQTRFPVSFAAVEAALEEHGEWVGDLRHVARDGRELIVAARKMLRRDAAGQPVAVLEALSDVTAQRAAEAALAESEARLALATAAAEIGIWDWDLRAGRLVCSAHLLAICGLDPAAELGFATVRRLIHRDDQRQLRLALRQARDPARRRRLALECRIRRPDGAIRHVALQGEPVFTETPRGPVAARVVGTLRDVTERWQLLAERFASEARLRLALEAGRMAVWEVDLQLRQLTGSPELSRLLGFPEGVPILLEALAARFLPGEWGRLRDATQAALARGEHFLETEFRYLSAGEVPSWLMLRAEFTMDAEGRPVRAIGVLLDISERRRTEEALRESEARLRLAVGAAGLTSWEIDLRQGRGRRGTPTSPAGTQVEEFALEEHYALLHPEDRPRLQTQVVELAAGRSEEFAIEYRIRGEEEASWRWIEAHGAVADRDPETGRSLRIAGVSRDITERKRTEERQALLAREVDHRAKNALTVVQAALRLTPKEDPEAYMRAVEGRVAALARAQTLLARGRWSGADLRTLLADELAPFLAEGAAAPRARLEGPPVLLWPAAAQALAMAVHELATNAVKHGALGRPGGVVAVRWRVEAEAALLLRLDWVETGGPPIPGTPARRGFGSRVLDGTVRAQLGGKVRQDWSASGLRVALEIPLLGGATPPLPTDVGAALR